LFAIRQGFEFVALHPEHGSIVVGLWRDIKTLHKVWHRVFDGDAIKRLRGLFSELAQRRVQQNTPTGET
jgi:hypothetical protein